MALGTTATRGTQAGANPSAPVFVEELTFAGDGAYPTGGTADFEGYYQSQTKTNRNVLGIVDVGANVTYEIRYDKANDKLLTFVKATGAQTANATDLSAQTFKVLVLSY